MTLTNLEFYIVIPAAATNEISYNPSIELTTLTLGGFGVTAFGAGVSIARSALYQRRGTYSLEVTTVNNVASGFYYATVNEVDTVTRTFSVDVYNPTAGQAMRIGIYTTAGAMLSETAFTSNGHWQRISVTRTGNASTTRRLYVIRDAVASVVKFYADGLYYSTINGTYLDGDMRGFLSNRIDYGWNGTAHASTSWRSAQTRSGGTLMRIKDYAKIISVLGLGMATITNVASPMIEDFSVFQTNHTNDREVVLNLSFSGTVDTMEAARSALIEAVKPDATAYKQPLILRYQGLDSTGADASEPLDIIAHYVDGMENLPPSPAFQKASPRFQVFLPYLQQAGDNGVVLDYNVAIANFSDIGYRDTDGQWKPMGTGANGSVKALVQGNDGAIYAGGSFAAMGGVANTRGIAKWNGVTWSALGTGLAGGYVSSMAIGPEGYLYIAGLFPSVGGVANTLNIAKWNGAAWVALGIGCDDLVDEIAFDSRGQLYAAGSFALAGGIANTVNIAKWDGGVWTPLSTGLDDTAYALAIASDNTVYVGGAFLNAGGVATTRIAKWDGSVFTPLGSGIGNLVHALNFGTNGILYAGGRFTDAGGITVGYLAQWNGSSWSAMGAGVNFYVYTIRNGPNNALYIGGQFTIAGSITVPDRGVIYQNGTWIPIDINVQDAAAYFYAYTWDKAGRLYLGGDWAGASALSTTVSVTNVGGAKAYPVFRMTGPGNVWQLKNYTTGAVIYFQNLTLLAGETAVLDLCPGRFKFTSSFRENLSMYISPGSNFDWFLLGGINNVSGYMTDTTASSLLLMSWQNLYWSVEKAKY